MKSQKEIKNECIEKWSDGMVLDERLNNFNDNFESWMDQIPNEYRDIVLKLIENLSYYSHSRVNQYLSELHKSFISNSNFTIDNTVFAFIKSDDGISNSSNDYWTEYKLINKINNNICFEDLDAIPTEYVKYIENIVFIDDFCGTGVSIIKELNKNLCKFKGKNVYYIVIDAMIDSFKALEEFGIANSITIIPLARFKSSKTFSCDYFENNDNAKTTLQQLSKKLKIPNGEILGFKNSESLVAFYNNTPNNTLGIIRYDVKNGYKSIFPRKHEIKPTWLKLKEQGEKRKRTNYNNSKGNI